MEYDGMFTERQNGPSKIFKSTLIAGAASGLTAIIFKPLVVYQYNHVSKFDCITLCNGIFAGLVSISASVDRVDTWAAFVIGVFGAVFYLSFCRFL